MHLLQKALPTTGDAASSATETFVGRYRHFLTACAHRHLQPMQQLLGRNKCPRPGLLGPPGSYLIQCQMTAIPGITPQLPLQFPLPALQLLMIQPTGPLCTPTRMQCYSLQHHSPLRQTTQQARHLGTKLVLLAGCRLNPKHCAAGRAAVEATHLIPHGISQSALQSGLLQSQAKSHQRLPSAATIRSCR